MATLVSTPAAKLHALAALALALAGCASSPRAPGSPQPQAARAGPLPKGIELGDLDRTADPCVDFFAFANGRWRAQNPIPPGQSRWSRRAADRLENRQELSRILDEVSRRTDWPAGSAEQLIGDHYASCMDEPAIEAAGLTPLAPLLEQLAAIHDRADVQRAIRRLHDLGVPAAFGATGDLDNREPSRFILMLTAGGLGLPDRDAYLAVGAPSEALRASYRAHVAKLLELAGRPAVLARHDADVILALEKRLAAASFDSAAAADPVATDHPMTFTQLQRLVPAFDWERYFDEAQMRRAAVNVAEPSFFQQLNLELTEAPVADWQAYLTWQLLESASPWLSKPFADESFQFRDRQLAGATERKPRAQLCLESTDALFGDALAKKYVERNFPPQAKTKAQRIAISLREQLEHEVAGLVWMAPETKRLALQKLAAYNLQLGTPERWKDQSGIAIHRQSFWANVAAGRRFAVSDNRRQVGGPSDRSRWALAASSPSAYLDLQLNEIVLPAGFLRPPAFRLEASDAVNYGAFGAGLAHDITHAIDAAPPQLDLQGRPRPWWTAPDLDGFRQRSQCLIAQADAHFIEPGVHLDGKLVVNEAVGDLAGVRLAYLAFERSQQAHPAPTIDGFTPEQQFFIAWGQMRGEAISPAAQRKLIKSDPHPVPSFRVTNPLSNLAEFQQAFACKAGAPMVRPPEQRCRIW